MLNFLILNYVLCFCSLAEYERKILQMLIIINFCLTIKKILTMLQFFCQTVKVWYLKQYHDTMGLHLLGSGEEWFLHRGRAEDFEKYTNTLYFEVRHENIEFNNFLLDVLQKISFSTFLKDWCNYAVLEIIEIFNIFAQSFHIETLCELWYNFESKNNLKN